MNNVVQEMICQNCGYSIDNANARFCPRCGAMVTPAIGLGVLDAEYSSLLFFPRQCDATSGLEATDVAVPGATVGGLWLERPGSYNVLVFFHGNGEVAADWAHNAERYAAALDASVWLVDYRGYGMSDGVPSYDAMLSDAEIVFNALARLESMRGRSFRHRFVFGRSLGSAPAIHIAWRFPNQVDALVIDSGFARITELIRRFRELRKLPAVADAVPTGYFDNIEKLAECGTPTLILHGAADSLIPIEAARRNLEASAAKMKRLVEIPDAGHNDLIFRSRADNRYFGSIRAFAAGAASGTERACNLLPENKEEFA